MLQADQHGAVICCVLCGFLNDACQEFCPVPVVPKSHQTIGFMTNQQLDY